MVKGRIGFIDASKGLCIIFIMIYHIIAPAPINFIISWLAVASVIYFFIVSGYFSNPNKRTTIKNILNRLKRLLIPFIVYSLVFFLIGSIILITVKGDSIETCLTCLRNFYMGAIWDKNILNSLGWDYASLGKRYLFLSCFWFLAQMIISSVIYFLIVKFLNRNTKVYISAIVILIAITCVFDQLNIQLLQNVHHTPMYVALLLIGNYFRKIDIFNTRIFKLKASVKWIIIIAMLIVFCLLGYMSDSATLYKGTCGQFGALSVICLIASSVTLFYIVSSIFKTIMEHKHQLKFLNWMGRNSLHYYLSHVFFAWIIATCINLDLSYSKDLPENVFIISCGVFVGAFILTTAYSYVREKISNKIFKNVC